ncbi:hypothetical protein SAMN04488511_12519 [Pedobacter suwonensis]|uniref:Uncharacterized protein n=1 Tax=Pedobacter suwonensis TaxID=332999 RepID=A0A1I0U7R0_9SPHI|nr:hypothetical protein SAMN04488511_12519 [Pedobacter suwonensis]
MAISTFVKLLFQPPSATPLFFRFKKIKGLDLLYLSHEIKTNYILIFSNSYFTVLENRKTSKDTGKNRWLPTLCVGACLSCVWAFAVPLKRISG